MTARQDRKCLPNNNCRRIQFSLMSHKTLEKYVTENPVKMNMLTKLLKKIKRFKIELVGDRKLGASAVKGFCF